MHGASMYWLCLWLCLLHLSGSVVQTSWQPFVTWMILCPNARPLECCCAPSGLRHATRLASPCPKRSRVVSLGGGARRGGCCGRAFFPVPAGLWWGESSSHFQQNLGVGG